MKKIGRIVPNLLAVVVSGTIVMGSITLALIESGKPIELSQPQPERTITKPMPTSTQERKIETSTIQPTVIPSSTSLPHTRCLPPEGWNPITIQAGENLASLAQIYYTSVQMLMEINCLVSEILAPGTILYVPSSSPTTTYTQTITPALTPTFTPSHTSIPSTTEYVCGPYPGWVLYTVQPNDTLYSLSNAFNVAVYMLQRANCMGTSTTIRAGKKIYVPNRPTITPVPATNTPVTATTSPTSTPIPMKTRVFTPFPRTPISTELPTPSSAAAQSPPDTRTPAESINSANTNIFSNSHLWLGIPLTSFFINIYTP